MDKSGGTGGKGNDSAEKLAKETMQHLKPDASNLDAFIKEINSNVTEHSNDTAFVSKYEKALAEGIKSRPEAITKYLSDNKTNINEPATLHVPLVNWDLQLAGNNIAPRDLDKGLQDHRLKAADKIILGAAQDKFNGIRQGADSDYSWDVTDKDLKDYTWKSRVAEALLRSFPATDKDGKESAAFKHAVGPYLKYGDKHIGKDEIDAAVGNLRDKMKPYEDRIKQGATLGSEESKTHKQWKKELEGLQTLKKYADEIVDKQFGVISYEDIQKFAKKLRIGQKEAEDAAKYAYSDKTGKQETKAEPKKEAEHKPEKPEVKKAAEQKKDSDDKVTAATKKDGSEPKKDDKVTAASKKDSDATGKTHEVQQGDTLYKIAREHLGGKASPSEVSALINKIRAENPQIKNVNRIYVGDAIKIPGEKSKAAPAAATEKEKPAGSKSVGEADKPKAPERTGSGVGPIFSSGLRHQHVEFDKETGKFVTKDGPASTTTPHPEKPLVVGKPEANSILGSQGVDLQARHVEMKDGKLQLVPGAAKDISAAAAQANDTGTAAGAISDANKDKSATGSASDAAKDKPKEEKKHGKVWHFFHDKKGNKDKAKETAPAPAEDSTTPVTPIEVPRIKVDDKVVLPASDPNKLEIKAPQINIENVAPKTVDPNASEVKLAKTNIAEPITDPALKAKVEEQKENLRKQGLLKDDTK